MGSAWAGSFACVSCRSTLTVACGASSFVALGSRFNPVAVFKAVHSVDFDFDYVRSGLLVLPCHFCTSDHPSSRCLAPLHRNAHRPLLP